MTMQQVETVLHLPAGTMLRCCRPTADGSEVEIIGAEPPWRCPPDGSHTLVLDFDAMGRLAGGEGTWWDDAHENTDVIGLDLH